MVEKHVRIIHASVVGVHHADPVIVSGLDTQIADNKCSRCSGSKCCTYVTEALGAAPRSKTDFEHLLWQVSHQGISVYKDRDGWFLLIEAVCSHLQSDGACGIYANRPQICRDYDNDWCEYDEPAENGFQLHFRNYDELLSYCRNRFKTWGR